MRRSTLLAVRLAIGAVLTAALAIVATGVARAAQAIVTDSSGGGARINFQVP